MKAQKSILFVVLVSAGVIIGGTGFASDKNNRQKHPVKITAETPVFKYKETKKNTGNKQYDYFVYTQNGEFIHRKTGIAEGKEFVINDRLPQGNYYATVMVARNQSARNKTSKYIILNDAFYYVKFPLIVPGKGTVEKRIADFKNGNGRIEIALNNRDKLPPNTARVEVKMVGFVRELDVESDGSYSFAEDVDTLNVSFNTNDWINVPLTLDMFTTQSSTEPPYFVFSFYDVNDNLLYTKQTRPFDVYVNSKTQLHGDIFSDEPFRTTILVNVLSGY